MKALHLSLAALAAFGIASCSSDIEPQTGETESPVTVNVSLPASFESRAFGDGSVAKKLSYAVYKDDALVYASDKAGSPEAVASGNNQFTLQLQLLKGREYEFMFWADAAEDSPYTFNSQSCTVTVNDAAKTLNDDTRDAFFDKQKVVISSDQVEAQLHRPFAQLNIATRDLAEYLSLVGKEAVSDETITVTVPTYKTLNLRKAVAKDPVEFTATANWAKDEKITINGEAFDVLSMNYILTGKEVYWNEAHITYEELLNVNVSIRTGNDAEPFSINLTNIPFRRNHRTNIYGSLLTSDNDAEIECLPGFDTPDNTHGTIVP